MKNIIENKSILNLKMRIGLLVLFILIVYLIGNVVLIQKRYIANRRANDLYHHQWQYLNNSINTIPKVSLDAINNQIHIHNQKVEYFTWVIRFLNLIIIDDKKYQYHTSYNIAKKVINVHWNVVLSSQKLMSKYLIWVKGTKLFSNIEVSQIDQIKNDQFKVSLIGTANEG